MKKLTHTQKKNPSGGVLVASCFFGRLKLIGKLLCFLLDQFAIVDL